MHVCPYLSVSTDQGRNKNMGRCDTRLAAAVISYRATDLSHSNMRNVDYSWML